jgi:DNA transformation protein
LDAEGLKELFSPFGGVTVKRMFGGYGVYADGLCFAIESRGEVYIKADADNEPEFVSAGSRPFEYEAKGKRISVAYWLMVAAAYDDEDELKRWARLGLEAARKAAAAKGKRGPKTRKTK